LVLHRFQLDGKYIGTKRYREVREE
jgi:hypothetical protein